ncbi:MAG: hypothetical protein NT016_02710 [Candidatus Aenigmarchaeota archaeon]|nr:hypothetical protein [Candidatus Aenigmarchaeota archaeon]
MDSPRRAFPTYLLIEDAPLYEKSEVTNSIRSMLEFGKEELENDNRIRLLANVGITEPGIWNPLKKDLYENLSLGMKFTHCTGPVICTDDNGSNAVLDAIYEFPELVSIEVNRLYEPTHWMAIEREDRKNFRVLVEGYHEPLQAKRCLYSAGPAEPIGRYLLGQFDWEFDVLKIVRDRPAPNDIPTLEEGSLCALLEKIKDMRMAGSYVTEVASEGQNTKIITSEPISQESRMLTGKVHFELLSAKNIYEILSSEV